MSFKGHILLILGTCLFRSFVSALASSNAAKTCDFVILHALSFLVS